ncbi:MAG: hypothetical protein QOI01_2314 [Mycobacterium sp.]|jgi:hypothetical protein|nr:hypothetical protein [Mycobacterium sp.]
MRGAPSRLGAVRPPRRPEVPPRALHSTSMVDTAPATSRRRARTRLPRRTPSMLAGRISRATWSRPTSCPAPNSARFASMMVTTPCVGGRDPPEETGCAFQYLLGALEFSTLLLQIIDPLRLRGGHTAGEAVVAVGLAHAGPHRLDAIASLTRHSLHGPEIGTHSAPKGPRTIRTADAFSSGVYLRVVGFPGDCSFGMTPTSFPRSGASTRTRPFSARVTPLANQRR